MRRIISQEMRQAEVQLRTETGKLGHRLGRFHPVEIDNQRQQTATCQDCRTSAYYRENAPMATIGGLAFERTCTACADWQKENKRINTWVKAENKRINTWAKAENKVKVLATKTGEETRSIN